MRCVSLFARQSFSVQLCRHTVDCGGHFHPSDGHPVMDTSTPVVDISTPDSPDGVPEIDGESCEFKEVRRSRPLLYTLIPNWPSVDSWNCLNNFLSPYLHPLWGGN